MGRGRGRVRVTARMSHERVRVLVGNWLGIFYELAMISMISSTQWVTVRGQE